MTNVSIKALLMALLACAPVALFASGDHGHGVARSEQELAPEGPHGGRLLQQDGFALEITLFERGVPPEYRLYAYRDGAPLAPEQVQATIELERLGGRRDRFTFVPEGDYLLGSGEVSEPHSFDVTVRATVASRHYEWHYQSHEGRTTIAARAAEVAGIATEPVGPETLRQTLTLNGRVVPAAGHHFRVAARYPGIVQRVAVQAGQWVEAGATLAIVESRDSLQHYVVTAPAAGVVLAHHVTAGSAAGDEPLFEIADMSQLWVELDAFPADLPRLANGQPVRLRDLADGATAQSAIAWVAPSYGTAQAAPVRVPLDNDTGRWRIGQQVVGEVEIATIEVPLAVRREAIQRFHDKEVVFARYGDTYEVRMIEAGRRAQDYVEVLGGIEPGTDYVVRNSYLIKADVMKSGASHDH